MKEFVSILLGVVLLLGALGHIAVPDFYAAMIPPFVNPTLAHVLSLIFEGGFGILLLIPKFQKWGGLGFMALMLAFLPIHIWDLFREIPAIGPHPIPVIRVAIQLLMIYAGFWVYKKYRA